MEDRDGTRILQIIHVVRVPKVEIDYTVRFISPIELFDVYTHSQFQVQFCVLAGTHLRWLVHFVRLAHANLLRVIDR